jgi:cell division protein FtsW
MVGSASVAMPGDYIIKQLVNLCISLFLAVVVLTIPLTTWTRFYWLGWVISLFLVVLVLVPGVGYEVKGATRWVRMGGFSLQAVEVAKFGLMIFLAGYLTHYHEMLQQSPNRILVPLAMVFIVCALVVAEPDLGSACGCVSRHAFGAVYGGRQASICTVDGRRRRSSVCADGLAGAISDAAYGCVYRPVGSTL